MLSSYVVTNSLRETSLDSECWTLFNRVDVEGQIVFLCCWSHLFQMWTDLFKKMLMWLNRSFLSVVGQIIFNSGCTFLKSVDIAGQIFLEAFPVKIELDAVVKHALEDI